jgi:methylmalonyl-CoA mutase cobalamin-binding subunit
VLYLGANLPAADIAHAAVQNSARAVALSIVYPGDDDSLPGELALLRRLVPAGIDIIAGGAAAPAYRAVLDTVGIIQLENLHTFTGTLAGLRARLTR